MGSSIWVPYWHLELYKLSKTEYIISIFTSHYCSFWVPFLTKLHHQHPKV